MSATKFRVYIAASLDGYIATSDGGIEWLEPYNSDDYGYTAFASEIDTIVIGRTTYEQVLGFGNWPYKGKRTIVLSSSPINSGPEGVEAYSGDAKRLGEGLKVAAEKDVWLLGGARTIRAFLDCGMVDQMEIFVMPVLLGDGLPLFEKSRTKAELKLVETESFQSGSVRLIYGLA